MKVPRAEAGFTLVELLVAMGLLGLAALLVAQGFAADHASLRRVEARAGEVDTIAAAQDLLRDRIEHLFPAARFDSAGPKVLFTGSSDSVDFLTADAGQGGGRPVLRLLLAPSAEGELALRELQPVNAPALAERTRVLLRDTRTLDVDYYGALQPGAPAGWRQDWAGSSVTPQLVRVRVAFADGDRRTWPELIVHPAAQVDTACILDASTLLCQGRA